MDKAAVSKILVPVDFGDLTEPSLAYAADLARLMGAALTIVHVISIPPLADAGAWLEPSVPPTAETDLLSRMRQAAEKRLAELAASLREMGTPAEARILVGTPYAEIIKCAQEMGAGLIVMGSQGRTGLSHFLIGSVAERVVRRSPINVLVVKPPAPPA